MGHAGPLGYYRESHREPGTQRQDYAATEGDAGMLRHASPVEERPEAAREGAGEVAREANQK